MPLAIDMQTALGCFWMPMPTRTPRAMCVKAIMFAFEFDMCHFEFSTSLNMFCSRTGIQYGGTALIYAATYGHDVCVRLLLDAGADKNVADNVRAFYIAADCIALFAALILF